MRVPHLALMLADVVERYPGRPATRDRKKGATDWVTHTYAEFDARIERVARGLVGAGMGPGDRVGLFSENRADWSVADFAILRAGAIGVPIYPSSTPEQLRHILRDCAAIALVCEGPTELAKLAEVWGDLPDLRLVVTFDPTDNADERVRPWATFGSADEAHGAEVAARLAAVTGDEVATIIYTSGTTGDPKGVVLTHRGFLAELDALDQILTVNPTDHSLCFLPLSHAFERAWTFYAFSHGCQNTYVTEPKRIAELLVEVKPTLFVSVPRLFEKVYAVALERVSSSPAKRRVFDWAIRVGGRAQHANRKGKRASIVWRAQLPLAEKLVYANIRNAIGGQKTILAAGGAPLRQDIEEFFSAAGVLIQQGYGLTEASPLISFNAPAAFKFGTVGRVMPGGEVRIGKDGEILYRGPNVMQGYWNSPEATAAAIDGEGYLHTGDIGYVDNQGFLVITDRLKDLLVTSGGKNIAPQPIEGMVLSDPLFEYAVLLGDRRPFVTLLVRPSLPKLEELAAQLQVKWENRDELAINPRVVGEIKKRVQAVTARLPQHEQIKDLRVMLEEFTQENGLLTPTLKIKRREVEKRFGAMIDDMYGRLADMRTRLGAGE